MTFASGVAVAKFEVFPYAILAAAWDVARDWRDNWRAYLRQRPEHMIEPARFDSDGVTTYVAQKAAAGVTFMTGLFDGRPGMALVALDGTRLHAWQVSFNAIWPDATQLDKQPDDWDTHIHGALLYPNGDVVLNFEYMGMARIDRCGKVIWRRPYPAHHSLFEDDRGNLWTGWHRRANEPAQGLPRYFPAPYNEEFIAQISPEGELLREISLVDVIVRSQYEGVLFANGRGPDTAADKNHPDIMHLNDVEVLSAAQAGRFPLFEEGDIMVSLRNLDLIAVIDRDEERIKWSMVGPYLRQHDPDFLDNGHISVFDNRWDDADGAVLGGSRILELDPVTRSVVATYAGDAGERFDSEVMGKHQHLANGNILITETLAGRAFEVTRDGEVVWSYINRWDEDEVAWIEEATRYPMAYAAFAEQGC